MRHHPERKVRFPGGGVELSGIVHEPRDRTTPDTVLLTHCFTCSKDYKILVAIARRIASDGIRALRFDFTGSGQSAGRFSDTSLSTYISDVVAAAQWVERQDWKARALVGHSLGAVAAILAARQLPQVLAVCAISAPSSASQLLELLPALATDQFERSGSVEVTIGPRKVRIGRAFVDELGRHSLEEATRSLDRGLLVVQGTSDKTTPTGEAEKLFSYARQPKAFFAVPGATHLFSEKEHADAVGRAVSLWLRVCGVTGGASVEEQ